MNGGREKQEKVDRSQYNAFQWAIIVVGRDEDNDRFGNIDDIDPSKYDFYQMEHVSRGRGSDKYFGDVSNLNPRLFSGSQMRIISIGRGPILSMAILINWIPILMRIVKW